MTNDNFRKKDILEMDNVELMAHALNVESRVTKEENFNRNGTTIATKKDYKWTMEELAKRFNLDFDRLTKLTASDHWWEQEGEK